MTASVVKGALLSDLQSPEIDTGSDDLRAQSIALEASADPLAEWVRNCCAENAALRARVMELERMRWHNGVLMDRIRTVLRRQPEWTSTALHAEIVKIEPSITKRQVWNIINYLVSKHAMFRVRHRVYGLEPAQ